AFSPSTANDTVFVASPSAIGRMPVASGSSVPEWLAFCASNARRTAPTACVDVIFGGLSRTSQPWTGLPFLRRAIVSSTLSPLGVRGRLQSLLFDILADLRTIE